jgi:hypothetical protein
MGARFAQSEGRRRRGGKWVSRTAQRLGSAASIARSTIHPFGGPMIGVLVTFTQTDKFDRSTLAKIADEERGTFEGMSGLRFKSFTIDDDGQAKNFYLWDDEEKARAFFSDEIIDLVTGIYGVAPKIEYLDVLEFVDNSGT